MSPTTSTLDPSDTPPAVDAASTASGHVAPPQTVRLGTRVALRVIRSVR